MSKREKVKEGYTKDQEIANLKRLILALTEAIEECVPPKVALQIADRFDGHTRSKK